MANRVQKAAATVVAIGAMLIAPQTVSGAGAQVLTHTSGSHVRSNSAAILNLIQQATGRSATFGELVETIDASDTLVYVQEGHCGAGRRACFYAVTSSAGRRTLWLRVDTRENVEWDLMGSIGHELRHALEVLDDASVTTNARMFLFYQRIGYRGTGSGMETTAAVTAGNDVRAEVQAFNRRAKAD